MIKFFRNIRQTMIKENKVSKYLLYAIGEIVLVVIGILIALQINNSNEARKTRATELNFLNNIKEDLQLNLTALDEFIQTRNVAITSCEIVLDYFEAKKELDLDDFNYHSLNVMIWFPFHQNDNTYQELLNSGQLSIISNKAIKDRLQNMQTSYKTIAFVENEMQQDFENYMYDPYFKTADLNINFENFNQQLSKQHPTLNIDKDKINTLLQNILFKNGYVLSKYNSGLLIEEYTKMKETTIELMALIDEELNELH
jgi:Family of unknown function (DUF6090)